MQLFRNWSWVFLSIIITQVNCSNSKPSETVGVEDKEISSGGSLDNKNEDILIPQHYRLRIKTYRPTTDSDSHSEGHVIIKCRVQKPGKVIELHGSSLQELIVESAEITSNDGTFIAKEIPQLLNTNATKNTLQFSLSTELQVNWICILSIKFKGVLSTADTGFFSLTKNTDLNTIEWVAATDFSTSKPSTAFPCFDNEQYRTPYVIELEHESQVVALSNMPPVGEPEPSEETGYMITKFQESIPLTASQVSFVVGDLKRFIHQEPSTTPEETDVNTTMVKVWTTKSIEDETDIIDSEAPSISKAVENYFLSLKIGDKHLSSIPKIDIIITDIKTAVTPSTTVGMIHYSNDKLPYKDKTISFVELYIYTYMMLTEDISYQWLYYFAPHERDLSDALTRHVIANYLKYFISYQRLLLLSSVMRDYAEKEVRRLMDLETVLDLEPHTNIFDGIRELKGCKNMAYFNKVSYSLIRMLNWTVQNSEVLMKYAIAEYILTDATSSDSDKELRFFVSLETLYNHQISLDEMKTWIFEAGYPVVTVDFVDTDDQKSVTISEEHFKTAISRGKAGSLEITNKSSWVLPVRYKTSSGKSQTELKWIRDGSYVINDLIIGNDWFIYDDDNSVFCRKNYPKSNWIRLGAALKSPNFGNISSSERAGLVEDILFMAWYGLIDYDTALHFIEFISQETDHAPLLAFVAGIYKIDHMFKRVYKDSEPHVYEKFQEFVRNLIEPVFLRMVQIIGFADTPPDPREFDMINARRIINELACVMGVETCMKRAETAFHDLRHMWPESDAENMLEANLRYTVYSTAVRTENGRDNWEFLYGIFQQNSNQYDQNVILAALISTPDKELQDRLKASLFKDQQSAGALLKCITMIFSEQQRFVPTHYTLSIDFLHSEDVMSAMGKLYQEKLFLLIPNLLVNFGSNKVDLDTVNVFGDSNNASIHLDENKVIGENITWVQTGCQEIKRFLLERNSTPQGDTTNVSAP